MTRLGEYEVGEPIGRGRIGAVYRIEDPVTGGPAALKVLAEEAPEAARARFVQEVEILSRIRHPHVLGFIRAELLSPGVLGLVTELASAETLRDRLTGDPLPPREAVASGIEIAGGLGHLHAHGVIHRDLKPENILVGLDGRLKIADFGLAKLLAAPSEDESAGVLKTSTGQMLGTPQYMAPEQFLDARSVTPRSDLFSLGLILYELLSGQLAVPDRSFFGIAGRLVNCRFDPIAAHVPTLDPELAGIVEGVLVREPADRPASAEALAERLTAWSA